MKSLHYSKPLRLEDGRGRTHLLAKRKASVVEKLTGKRRSRWGQDPKR